MLTKCGEVESFLLRNGIGTTQILADGPLKGSSDKAVERLVSRLLAEGTIESHQLMGPSRYYVLSGEACRRHGINDGRSSTQAFGHQGLLQNFAMTLSGVYGNPPKQRLTRDEFAQKLPMLCENGRAPKHYRTRYFIDDSLRAEGVVRIGLFVVDLGQHMRRLVRKVRREVERRRVGRFAELVQQKLLVPFVLTSSNAKAKQLETMLREFEYPRVIEVHDALGRLLR